MVRSPLHRQHLQAPGRAEDSAGRGDEPVEPRTGCVIVAADAAVLGLVDDAGLRVERHRLVDETAHGLERHGVDRAVGAGGHLEDVAVRDPADRLDGLLAGEPRAPRGEAAGAVGARAPDAHPLATEASGVPAGVRRVGGVELHGGGAAVAGRVVAAAAQGAGLRAVLVVAHEAGEPGAGGEGGHAVVAAGQRPDRSASSGHGKRRPRLAEGDVAEPFGEPEVAHVDERPVATVVRAGGRTSGRAVRPIAGSGEESDEGPRRHGGGPSRHGATGEEPASVHRRHGAQVKTQALRADRHRWTRWRSVDARGDGRISARARSA